MVTPTKPKMASTTKSTSPGKRVLTPLWVISLFVSLTETVLGVAVTQTSGNIQVALTVFVLLFPLGIAGGFFAILWKKPWFFYSPQEFSGVDPGVYVDALQGKSLKIVTETKDLGDSVTTFGNPDRFELLFKAKGGSWKKSTKAMEVPGGCIVQVSTEEVNPDGSKSIGEAVTFVPGVIIIKEAQGDGRYIGYIDSGNS